MTATEKFFLFCSGADLATLDRCPTDRHKYMGIGATIFFTGVLAFFSSAYALFTVFESYPAAVGFGLVWGAMIFNLDRYIVMSMKSVGRWWRDLFIAVPRLLLAGLLAVVISRPLELKIFEKEIQAELGVMQQEVYKTQEAGVQSRFQNQIEQKRAEIANLKSEIVQKSAHRDTLLLEANREADGTGGSRQRNLGPIYQTKKLAADQAQAELDSLTAKTQPQILEKEKAIAQLEADVRTETAALDRTKFDGMAARMEALRRLTERSPAILLASLFILLLFVAIETAPIFVKLISPRSPYDYLLHEQEHVFEMSHLEKTTLLGNSIKNKLKHDTEVGLHDLNARITAEKAVIDQKLQETLEGLKGSGGTLGWQ